MRLLTMRAVIALGIVLVVTLRASHGADLHMASRKGSGGDLGILRKLASIAADTVQAGDETLLMRIRGRGSAADVEGDDTAELQLNGLPDEKIRSGGVGDAGVVDVLRRNLSPETRSSDGDVSSHDIVNGVSGMGINKISVHFGSGIQEHSSMALVTAKVSSDATPEVLEDAVYRVTINNKMPGTPVSMHCDSTNGSTVQVLTLNPDQAVQFFAAPTADVIYCSFQTTNALKTIYVFALDPNAFELPLGCTDCIWNVNYSGFDLYKEDIQNFLHIFNW